MEGLFLIAILFSRYRHSCINRLRKVLMKHLFPGFSVVALEQVFKLCKRVGPIKVAFLCSLVELRDGFVNGKFNTIFVVILMDVYSAFITSIITLKLINFGKVRIVVLPGLHDLIKRHLLVNQGHIVRRWCGVGGQLNGSCQAWIDWLLLCNLSCFI
jgi:hypothetical protein